MTISIAMCTYNGACFLEQQLLSIRAQTEQPFELVVCDDGSTDATSAIVEAFRESVAFPISFHRNASNLGSTKNFEQAIRMCRGDIIALCDQDDVWAPEKLATMARALRTRPELAAVFSNAALIDANGQPRDGNLWARSEFTARKQRRFNKMRAAYALIDRDTVTGATLLFRSRYVEQIVPIPAEWVHDGWIALILASVAEIQPIASCLVQYRIHGRQQVGARQVSWQSHLYTPKNVALSSHAKIAQRFQQMEEKLLALGADKQIVAHLDRKVSFLKGRIADLERPRGARLFSITRKLRDYAHFEKGLMSMLRDLAH